MTDCDKLILTTLKDKGPMTSTQLGMEMAARGYNGDTGCNAISVKLIGLANKNFVLSDRETQDEFTGRMVKVWRLTGFTEASFLELVQRDFVAGVEG